MNILTVVNNSLHCMDHLRNHYTDFGDLVGIVNLNQKLPAWWSSSSKLYFFKMARGLESSYVIQNTDLTAVYNIYFKYYLM